MDAHYRDTEKYMKNKKHEISEKGTSEPVIKPVAIPLIPGFDNGKETACSYLAKLEKAHLNTVEKGIGMDIFPGPGLREGKLTILCSMPSQGKTAYLANIVSELALQGRNVGVFLPDMPPEWFVARVLSLRTGADYTHLRRGTFPRDTWIKLKKAEEDLAQSGIYFSQLSSMNYWDIDAEASRLATELKKAGRKLDAVVIDSLNYLKQDEDVPELTMGLSLLAHGSGAAVLCSLGLQENKNIIKRQVSLGDIRLAGINEQETNQILYLQRPGYYEPRISRDKANIRTIYGEDLSGYYLDLDFNNSTMKFTNNNPPPAGDVIVEETSSI